MTKAKTAVDDGKTQYQGLLEAARKLGADEDADGFRHIVRKVAAAAVTKPKKAAGKPKPKRSR